MRKSIQILLTVLPLVFCMQAAGASELGVDVTFDDGEIKIIRAYYHSHGDSDTKDSHGKNKSKDKALPPGIAKNLQRGKPLPPGIAKRYLPGDLRLELPKLPDGYERIIVAGKILIIEISTQIIQDVLTDILFD